MMVKIAPEGMSIMEVPKPLSSILDRIVAGEVVLVEYNSPSNVDLLPFKLISIKKSVLVEIGDKLHVKLYALMNALKNSELLENIKRTPIISVSNFAVSFPGFNITNIPFNEVSSVISKFYSFMT